MSKIEIILILIIVILFLFLIISINIANTFYEILTDIVNESKDISKELKEHLNTISNRLYHLNKDNNNN